MARVSGFRAGDQVVVGYHSLDDDGHMIDWVDEMDEYVGRVTTISVIDIIDDVETCWLYIDDERWQWRSSSLYALQPGVYNDGQYIPETIRRTLTQGVSVVHVTERPPARVRKAKKSVKLVADPKAKKKAVSKTSFPRKGAIVRIALALEKGQEDYVGKEAIIKDVWESKDCILDIDGGNWIWRPDQLHELMSHADRAKKLTPVTYTSHLYDWRSFQGG